MTRRASTGGAGIDWFGPVVTLGAAAVAAVVFFAMTVPAWRERAALREIEQRKVELRNHLLRSLSDARARAEAMHWDVQAVLVAIDELGLTPAELLADATELAPPPD